ncbi:hypothetical protein KFL_001780180, partial [Klebsormidium nitens]
KNAELHESLLKVERDIAKLGTESVISELKLRSLTNALLDRSGKKDIKTEEPHSKSLSKSSNARREEARPGRVREDPRAVINALLEDKKDSLGLQKRVKDVAAQVSLRPQDITDSLRNLYNRFAATSCHGLDGPLVLVNQALIPEVNVRAALCLFLDWGKVTYAYIEDGVVVKSPYRLPSDPSIEIELGMSLPAIQDRIAGHKSF